MTATPPASWISSIACAAVGQRRGTKALAPGHQVLLEEGPEVAARAGRPGDVGPADRERVAGLAHGVLEVQVEALLAQLLDDLAGPGHPLVLGALAGAGDPPEVDPVAADVEVFGVLVHAGHLDRRDQLDPELGRRRLAASATPAIASWSVSASVVTPASAASATTSAGASWPSETVEWLCSSINMRRQPSL